MAARLLSKSLLRRHYISGCHTPITYPPLIPPYLNHHHRHHSSKPQPTKTNVSPSPSSSFTFSSSPCPLYFHYEDVMRQDLLLKLNYDNIMEVPQLSAARVVPKAATDGKDVNLAVEIPCGQKVIQTEKDSKGNVVRSRSMSSAGKRGSTNTIARQITLRGQGMSNFLVRMLTVMSLLDSPVQIQGNYIRFLADTEFLEFAPELEDHFEILEHIRGFNVTVVTSANTQDETKLLWSGFMQKDKKET